MEKRGVNLRGVVRNDYRKVVARGMREVEGGRGIVGVAVVDDDVVVVTAAAAAAS